ncbi:Fibronectin type III domain-containing protein [Pustulibacterium marinum]|uniref:Fibronectin type III domain-containing protein n=1 Tax=Pustulibacterium marinum TaxID=1224947 RepID=A0A1I7J026_9FLAO|nr:choice-of-anchor L domain-containing protein [Pustulibacterium marinum]SFU78530.1 Fibronectin type III domain-containing protein [Pustulibacterium marinum]
MKKTTLLILMLFMGVLSFAQTLNEPANWPNADWSITGSYESGAAYFEANPTTDSNFSYDDYNVAAGGAAYSAHNTIAAESPVIDLTAAQTAGETWLYFTADYVYNFFTNDDLMIQYWDADAGTWENWVTFDADTPSAPSNNYCSGTSVSFTSELLDVSSFTATQLSGFKYRIYFTDNDLWTRGFCFSSPTIYSEAAPTCPDLSNITVADITDTSVEVSWTAGGSETAWFVVVQEAGTGVPTIAGVSAGTNPYVYTGLDSNTAYEVYVMTDCGGGDLGNWVGSITFTTVNTPPTAPDGVSCEAGVSSSFIFTEDFDEAGFWTGDVNDNSASWEIPDGSTSANTGPVNAYNGDNFMNFEATGASGDVGSIVSPAIDLAGATGEIELSFYMYAYGAGMGTLEVGVATDAAGPFTNVFTWAGEYQTAQDEEWVGVAADLTAYAGETVYIEFKQTATSTGAYYSGDMAIDYMRVEACGDFCIAPTNIMASNLTDTTAELSWTANNSETSWQYIVVPTGTEPNPEDGIVVTSLPVSVSDLDPDTTYDVYVMADCGDDFYSIWTNPYTFTTEIQTEFTVDCAVGPTNVTYCYLNNDATTFHFTASDGTTAVNLLFNSGYTESGWDYVTIYDTDINSPIYTGSGDLSGMSFQSSGADLYVLIESNGSDSCADGGTSEEIDMMVNCITCVNQTVDYDVVNDCLNGEQFLMDVIVSDMGDATSLSIMDSEGSEVQTATATGTFTFGPYENGTEVSFIVENNDDPNCIIYSATYTQETCPPMSVSTDEYTIEELITDVLINSECAQVSNVIWDGASNYTSFSSIGYFYDAYNFSFTEGIVLSSGNVSEVPGPNNGLTSSTGTGWNGDADLLAIAQENDPTATLNNASYIQFDFVPLTDHISFDFLFASEEYTSTFECNYSDIFAFILTDSEGNTSNLAVVPGTTIPVMVTTVHGGVGSCGPANAEYFDQYNGDGTGLIAFDGQTVVMTAEADVVVGDTYTIKLGIADEQDSSYDSAVFLQAGSFDIGDIDLGEDILLEGGNANCEGDVVVLDAGTIPDSANIVWYKDGEAMEGETTGTLSVTDTGNYEAIVTYNNTTCSYSDDITIEFFPVPEPYFDVESIIKCANEQEVLTAYVSNLNDLPGNITYDWYDDGELVQSSSSNTYTLSSGEERSGIFTVIVTDDTNGCNASAEMEVIFYDNAYCVIPQGLSPGTGADNECMTLDFLDDRDNIASMKVYNRLGTEVYDFENYVDQWCGTDNDGNILPVGTYFYVITFVDGRDPITGYVYLNY